MQRPKSNLNLLGHGVCAVLLLALACQIAARAEDPLALVERRPGKTSHRGLRPRNYATRRSPKFVPPAERIATFDQDGTLWVEHPMYTQVMYCLDRVPALVEKNPELKDVEPFKTVLSGDREAMAKLSHEGPRKNPRRHAHRHVGGGVQRRREEVARQRPSTRAGNGRTPNSPTCRCRKS